jgi:hypothetical protein
VVGQHGENQPASSHRRPNRLPLQLAGRSIDRAALTVDDNGMAPSAPAEPVADDQGDPRDDPSPSLETLSFGPRLAKGDRAGTSLDVDGLRHPPVDLAPATARPEHARSEQTRAERGRPTSERVGRATRAVTLLLVGVLVAVFSCVAGLHEAGNPRPKREVTPPRSVSVRTQTDTTRAPQARGRVGLRHVRRRDVQVRHRRPLGAHDAGLTQPRPTANRSHLAPSSSPPPSVPSPAAQPRAEAPAAVSSPPPVAFPPSPAGPLPGPPPT